VSIPTENGPKLLSQLHFPTEAKSNRPTRPFSLPNLPEEALRAHIFPKLTSGALLSVSQLCNHGCSVSFDADQVTVTSDERIILTGPRNRTNGLRTVHLASAEQTLPKPWIPPPQNCTYATQLPTVTAPTELHQVANNAFATQTKQELVAFLHASCFSPVPSTLLAAISLVTSPPGPASQLPSSRNISSSQPPPSKATCNNNARTPGPPRKRRPFHQQLAHPNKKPAPVLCMLNPSNIPARPAVSQSVLVAATSIF
jgi:hypothetical protein